jgi:hypothetical protein
MSNALTLLDLALAPLHLQAQEHGIQDLLQGCVIGQLPDCLEDGFLGCHCGPLLRLDPESGV